MSVSSFSPQESGLGTSLGFLSQKVYRVRILGMFRRVGLDLGLTRQSRMLPPRTITCDRGERAHFWDQIRNLHKHSGLHRFIWALQDTLCRVTVSFPWVDLLSNVLDCAQFNSKSPKLSRYSTHGVRTTKNRIDLTFCIDLEYELRNVITPRNREFYAKSYLVS